MLNEKYTEEFEEEVQTAKYYDSYINRIKSTLNGRIKLINLFSPLVKDKFEFLTIENIGIDLDNKDEIYNYLIESTTYIENTLRPLLISFFEKNGSLWQKSRT